MRQAPLTGMSVCGFPSLFQTVDARTGVKRCLTRFETRCAASGLHLIHSSMFNHAPLREFFGTIHALYHCGEVFETHTLPGWYPAGAERRKANEGWPEEKAGPGTKER